MDVHPLVLFVVSLGLEESDLVNALRGAGLGNSALRGCDVSVREPTPGEVAEFSLTGRTRIFLSGASGPCFVSLVAPKSAGRRPTLRLATMRSLRELAEGRARREAEDKVKPRRKRAPEPLDELPPLDEVAVL